MGGLASPGKPDHRTSDAFLLLREMSGVQDPDAVLAAREVTGYSPYSQVTEDIG